jgi:SAM-dependent methyltransferase
VSSAALRWWYLMADFQAGQFWNERLTRDPSLRGTGHRAFSLSYNRYLYAAQADALYDLAARWNVPFQDASVLDVGSGIGFFVNFFRERGVRVVVGLDIAPTSVQYLREAFPEYEFQVSDIGERQSGGKCEFDIVSAFNVLYHIVDDNRFKQALENLALSTKLDGYLIISDCFIDSRMTPRHVRFRALAHYAEVFDGLGLRILESLPVYYLMNRVFVPKLGPAIISYPAVARTLYNIDRHWRRAGRSNGNGMKFLLAKRVSISSAI